MTRLDWRSACLSCTADREWRRKIWVGGLVLMIPVLGWPMVLGWRRLFVERLLRGDVPLLPPWRGNRRRALCGGLAATAVIHVYYAPLYAWLAVRTTQCALWRELPWLPVLLALLCLPIFSTLTVPLWIAGLRWAAGGPGSPELTVVAALFAGVTFVIPAGFLQVSRSGRIVSAFALPAALRTIRRHTARYVEAWIGSGAVSLAGHLCGPWSPWGVVWCYLAIVYAFNEVPQGADGPPDRAWFGRFRSAHWEAYAVRSGRLVEHYERESTEPVAPGTGAARFRALRVGPLRLPLP